MSFTSVIQSTVRAVKHGVKSLRDPGLAGFFGERPSASGVEVTEYTAMNLATVYQAQRIIAETCASLPLPIYKHLPDGGKERDRSHRLHDMLNHEPNPDMSAMTFRETITAHVTGWGNGFAEIERDNAERAIHLWPIAPPRVRVDRDAAGRVIYYTRKRDGSWSDPIPARNMIHIAGLGFDGLVGYNVFRMAREAIGLALAAETFGASFFGNGTALSGFLSKPDKVKNRERLREEFRRFHEGAGKSHRFAILEEGLTWTQLGVSPDAAQFLQTRKFQKSEIASWFNLPPHKLGDLERATFSNIEQQSIDFVTHSIRPWLIRWEHELRRKLLNRAERQQYTIEHVIDALLRGETKARYEAHAIALTNGWLNADEVREIENRNPLPEGKGQVYRAPLNMAPVEKSQSKRGRPIVFSMSSFKRSKPKQPAAPAVITPEVRAAHKEVFKDTASRMLRKEALAARSAAKKPADFVAWIDSFYAKHEPTFRSAMQPAIGAYAAIVAPALDVATAAQDLARRHVDASRTELLAAAHQAAGDVDQLAQLVGQVADAWENGRPEQLAQGEIEQCEFVTSSLAAAA